MKAAVYTRYGPPEVVRVFEVEKPRPDRDDVLVQVHVATVNRTDCAFRGATPWVARPVYGLVRPRATILGSEFAGIVAAVGQDVTSFGIGDRVFGYNEGPFGAHAEYMSIPESASIAQMPANVSYEEAAASTEGSHYASSLIKAAKIRSGQEVLVNGATGGIGSAAVQLLKSLDADVTAVCASNHVELVRDLGASRVIDYTAEDFTHGTHSYDVIVDAVGKSSFGRCRHLLKPHGVYLSTELGRLAQNPVLALLTKLSRGKRVLFPIPKHDQAMIEHFKSLMESGDLRPVIDRRYSLEHIVEAYRYVETGQKVGNVVITIQPSS
jgi:NADPH:quinone reductase-like Zn-dependent oxidoreductase